MTWKVARAPPAEAPHGERLRVRLVLRLAGLGEGELALAEEHQPAGHFVSELRVQPEGRRRDVLELTREAQDAERRLEDEALAPGPRRRRFGKRLGGHVRRGLGDDGRGRRRRDVDVRVRGQRVGAGRRRRVLRGGDGRYGQTADDPAEGDAPTHDFDGITLRREGENRKTGRREGSGINKPSRLPAFLRILSVSRQRAARRRRRARARRRRRVRR